MCAEKSENQRLDFFCQYKGGSFFYIGNTFAKALE